MRKDGQNPDDSLLDPTLSAEQRQQLREILADESAVAPRLDVSMPGEVMLRVNARLISSFRHPQRSSRVIKLWVGSAVSAAVAACLVLAAMLHGNFKAGNPSQARPETALTSQEAADAYAGSVDGPIDMEMDVLNEQMAALQQDFAGSNDSLLQLQIDAVDQDISDFWVENQVSPEMDSLD